MAIPRCRGRFVTCEVLPEARFLKALGMPDRREERSSRRHRKTERYLREVRSLGDRMRRLRQRHHWTLEAAAERMDLEFKHLQKIEAGTVNVTMVTLVRIAAGLDVPVRALFAASRRRAD
jgi:DNA-binding XRE family transcriptional regulator